MSHILNSRAEDWTDYSWSNGVTECISIGCEGFLNLRGLSILTPNAWAHIHLDGVVLLPLYLWVSERKKHKNLQPWENFIKKPIQLDQRSGRFVDLSRCKAASGPSCKVLSVNLFFESFSFPTCSFLGVSSFTLRGLVQIFVHKPCCLK